MTLSVSLELCICRVCTQVCSQDRQAIIQELCLVIRLGTFLILTELQILCLIKTDEMS